MFWSVLRVAREKARVSTGGSGGEGEEGEGRREGERRRAEGRERGEKERREGGDQIILFAQQSNSQWGKEPLLTVLLRQVMRK